MTSPRDGIRRVLDEMPLVRKRLVTHADMATVRVLDDWRRWLEFALTGRATGETPAVVDEPDE